MGLKIELDDIGGFGFPAVFHDEDPGNEQFHLSFVVRIQQPVPGAVGDPKNGGYLIGYSPVCTHMGCRLVRGTDDHSVVYDSNGEEQLTCGPCPCHGTTFDLLKQGLVVLGPATQNLAQLKLQFDQGEVTASDWIEHSDPRTENWPYTLPKTGESQDG